MPLPLPGLRDLRLCAAHRRRAPARRQGRARRHPLVGPARGLPHRGARPDEGADGQERRHRAGRRQGRLRGQAAARGRRPRGAPGRGGRVLPDPDPRPARPDRQPGRRRIVPPSAWSATTTTIPIWWSPPTRAPPPSPTSPTRSAWNTASGSATPSRPAARPATTTRAWASPRAAPGNRSSATSASWARTARPSRSPRSASATCRATCSATACCCRDQIRLIAAFDHRHIFIDPDPDPAVGFAERERLFELPRSSWDDYDRSQAQRRRRRSTRAASSRSGCRPEARQRARHRGRGVHAARADPRDPAGAGRPVLERRHRHLCQGRRRAPRRGVRSRPTTRSGSTPSSCAARWSARAAISASRQRGRIAFAQQGRAHQHRLHRQLGRRRLLGSRGQHQDPARRRGRRRRHDRRSSATSCSPTMTDEVAELVLRNNVLQVQAISLAEARSAAELLDSQAGFMRRLEASGRLEPRARGAARRRDAGAAPADGPGAVPARGRGAARLRQDDAVRRAAGVRAAGRSLSAARSGQVLPAAAAQALPAARSSSIGCAARSSRRWSPTAWSTAASASSSAS